MLSEPAQSESEIAEGLPSRARLEFKTLSFDDRPGDRTVRLTLLNLFYADLAYASLDKISPWSVSPNAIEFSSVSKESAGRKFNFLLARSMLLLKNRINDNPAVYVHKNSGIPLLGNLSFGIVDKGSTLLEIKPITSCNANCVFCSVDEGPSSKKILDFVVEKDYLVEELEKMMAVKDKDMTIYLNPQGDPTLYKDLVELVADVSRIPRAKDIVLITNGMLLHPAIIDELYRAGLSSIHVSLSAIDLEKAKLVMGIKGYDVERVKKNIQHMAAKGDVLLTPVFVPGMNEEELPKIIEFAKSIGCTSVGVQNFMTNPRGRNPVKPMPWEKFEEQMKLLEKRHGITLLDSTPLGSTPELPRPFKRDDVVSATIVCQGRYPRERIAASQERTILLQSCDSTVAVGDKVSVRIRKSNHNIFVGELVG
ncbi:radical SAM protein [Candidatus Woesearchaeota archaeon]|nr:radical SAM protein [Candidatus Woesearchaeota archaeon]